MKTKKEKKWYQIGTHRLDKVLNQFISKRLAVFIVSCYFFHMGLLGDLYWTILAGIWMIQQGANEVIKQFIINKSK